MAWAAAQQVRNGGGSGSSSSSGGGFTSGGAGGRLESEVHNVLAKAMGQAHMSYKRIGIVGALAFLRRTGQAMELLGDDGAEGEAEGAGGQEQEGEATAFGEPR